jgi:hypothetical protein
MIHKSMSRAFKWVVIQPDIIIYGETLRTASTTRNYFPESSSAEKADNDGQGDAPRNLFPG